MKDRPHGMAGRKPKFSTARVNAWRKDYRSGKRSGSQIARDEGMPKSTMISILSYQRYHWLP